jgi:hypothetical protein
MKNIVIRQANDVVAQINLDVDAETKRSAVRLGAFNFPPSSNGQGFRWYLDDGQGNHLLGRAVRLQPKHVANILR